METNPGALLPSLEDLLTCIKAVAMMTPDPKYLVIKKANGGTCMRFVLAAAMGSRAPVTLD